MPVSLLFVIKCTAFRERALYRPSTGATQIQMRLLKPRVSMMLSSRRLLVPFQSILLLKMISVRREWPVKRYSSHSRQAK